MNRIFKEQHLENQLNHDGYVKIPLLSENTIAELVSLYRDCTAGERTNNSKYGLYVTIEELDTAKSEWIEKKVEAMIKEELTSYFMPYKAHLGGFLMKNPDPFGYTYPHQDWTFVDHDRFRSVTVWVALMPISKENSTLGFARNSAPYFNTYPVGTPVTVMKSGTTGHEKLLYEYLHFMDISPGEAFVFDNRTVHAATPNQSNSPRLAYALTLSPPEAPLVHYLHAIDDQNQETLVKFLVDKRFFHDYTIEKADHLYEQKLLPAGYTVEKTETPSWRPTPLSYVEDYLTHNKLSKNGEKIHYAHEGDPNTSSKTFKVRGKSLKTRIQNLWKRK